MSTFSPIIVGVDGSDAADTAVRWATVDAARHHAPLHLVDAVALPIDYGPGLSITQVDYDAIRKDARDRVAQAEALAQAVAVGLPAEVEMWTFVDDAPPIPALIERSRNARLMVVGTRGMGAVRRGLLGSVSTSLSRHAHCPVAVIPDVDDLDSRTDAPVVVGIDGSPSSIEAIRIAFDEAQSRGVELIAMHSWNDDGRLLWRPEVQEEGNGLLSENLAGFAVEYPDVQVQRAIIEHRPTAWLLDATRTAQLVVVGSHGRGGFAGMTLGSVSQAVLHGAEGPIIIARGKD